MTPVRMAVRRFTRHRLAMAGLVVLVLIVFATVFAGVLSGYDPAKVDLSQVWQAPNTAHWLGTDGSGRDVLARLLYAGRVSLLVGVLSSLLAVVLGTVLGAVAGVVGGWVDGAIMRAADVFLSRSEERRVG